MKLSLNKKEFLETIKSGAVPPLYCDIPYYEPYRVYALLCTQGGFKNSILLESVKGHHKTARYSFIAYDPYLIFMAKNNETKIELKRSKKWKSGHIEDSTHSVSFRHPLQRLKEIIDGYPQKASLDLPPFQGGAVGLLSYDFVRHIEDIPRRAVDDLNIPDMHFLMVDSVISFDHLQKKAWLVISPGARHTELGYTDISQIDWITEYDYAKEKLHETIDKINSIDIDNVVRDSSGANPAARNLKLNYETSKEQYMKTVMTAKEYIAAGDIFQANLSQRISARIGDTDPWEIYKILRTINPSPFAAYADFGDYKIVSSSPERLVRLKDNIIETRPIAGTRPRGSSMKEDELMRAELLLNKKERAEHIMLIDLERNDIGRVSEYGSVVVDEFMITEDYSHVIHIVSNIRGILEKGRSCFDLIKAVFPGGTITGVPKVRCMEIIDELEPVCRGPYTGSLGYIGFSGNMDLNIIIRTFVIKDGYAYVQAGAGIVADSDPEKEYYETLKKAEALIRTLEETDRKK